MLLTCRTDYFKSITEQSSFFQAQNRAHIDPKEDYTCAILLPFTEDQIKEYFRQVFKDKDRIGYMLHCLKYIIWLNFRNGLFY